MNSSVCERCEGESIWRVGTWKEESCLPYRFTMHPAEHNKEHCSLSCPVRNFHPTWFSSNVAQELSKLPFNEGQSYMLMNKISMSQTDQYNFCSTACLHVVRSMSGPSPLNAPFLHQLVFPVTHRML